MYNFFIMQGSCVYVQEMASFVELRNDVQIGEIRRECSCIGDDAREQVVA